LKDILNLNKRAWDNIAKKYDERTNTELSDVFIDFTLKLPDNSKVLDLGCGTGLPHDKHLVEMGFNVIGVDISSEMIKVASENVPDAIFIQLSMNEIEYEEEFNGVLSSFSMLLLTTDLFKETAFRIYSALTKPGYFYLSLNEPANLSDDPDSEVFVNIIGQDMYSRAYTVEEVERVFLPLGFSLLKFNRVIQVSDEFGEEHVIEFIFQKK
jgi:SAM-dependent methyltransferase